MLKNVRSRVFSNRIVFLVIASLFVTFILDSTFAKTYNIINKQEIPIQIKTTIFCVNLIFCVIFQFFIMEYTKSLTKIKRLRNRLSLKFFERLGRVGFFVTIALTTFLVFQIAYFQYYSPYILMSIVLASYGIAAILIAKTAFLFFSWFRQSHNPLIFMYFISMLLIFFTLFVTNLIVNIYLNERPEKIGEFVGGSIDITGGKYSFLNPVYKFSSVVSFFSIWLTTSLLMYSTKDRLIKQVRYWIIPIILLSYFLTSYLAQEIYRPIIFPLIQYNPILLSIVLIMVFALVKPIGGIMFGVAFWRISNKVNFEKTLKGFMIISGYGFLLLFSSNQASSLVLAPYPPFGVATVTILIGSSYLIMVSIYTSATLVSINANVRNSIHQIAKESKLLNDIGMAEMEKEITNIVTKISRQTQIQEDFAKTSFNIDEEDLKNYIIEVAEELKRKKSE